jgi:leader peptidase (prepilin peptidase) / N-methyltransferase
VASLDASAGRPREGGTRGIDVRNWLAERPLTSGSAAALAAAVVATHGLDADAVLAAGLAGVLVILSKIDLERRILPNRIVLPTTAVMLAAQVLLHPAALPSHLLCGVAAAAFLLAPALIRADAMGMGDVKLALLLGIALGTAVVSALFIGLSAVGILSLFLLARGGREALRQHVPLGPFLAFGAILTILFGA